MLAVAALLWVAYLLPSWVRRREYLATERNAVRLQQTLRVMAETADLPDAVRVESTSRDVAAQRRSLQRHAKLLEEAARERQEAAERAARATLQRLRPELAKSLAHLRVRRTRAALSLAMLVAAVVALVALGQLLTATGGGVNPGSLFALATCAGVLGWGAWAHTRLTAIVRARIARDVEPPRMTRPRATPAAQPQQAQQPVVREWTPVPVPKPLYLSKPVVPQPVVVERDLVAELRAEERERQQALAAAHAEPEVVPINDAVRSRFASMGVIDREPVRADIDAALRRRRA